MIYLVELEAASGRKLDAWVHTWLANSRCEYLAT